MSPKAKERRCGVNRCLASLNAFILLFEKLIRKNAFLAVEYSRNWAAPKPHWVRGISRYFTANPTVSDFKFLQPVRLQVVQIVSSFNPN